MAAAFLVFLSGFSSFLGTIFLSLSATPGRAALGERKLPEEGVGLGVDLGLFLDVDGGALGDEVESSFSFLLLDLQRDSLDGTSLDALHQVSRITGDLVPQSLCGHFGVVGQDLLVNVEVEGQLQVVSLHELSGGSLHGLGSDSALHD